MLPISKVDPLWASDNELEKVATFDGWTSLPLFEGDLQATDDVQDEGQAICIAIDEGALSGTAEKSFINLLNCLWAPRIGSPLFRISCRRQSSLACTK